jgi:hypothetical protein
MSGLADVASPRTRIEIMAGYRKDLQEDSGLKGKPESVSRLLIRCESASTSNS